MASGDRCLPPGLLLDVGALSCGGLVGLARLVQVPPALVEIFEDVADWLADFAGAEAREGKEAAGGQEGPEGILLRAKGEPVPVAHDLRAFWVLQVVPSFQATDPLVVLGSVATSAKMVCALAACALAAGAHSMLRRHPEERRDRMAQRSCSLVLAVSGVAYTWFALSRGVALPQINRPELVLRSLCDGTAVSVFMVNLSLLAEQSPEHALPATFWALLSTGGAAAAAAVPDASAFDRMVMLGFSFWSAEVAGQRALVLADAAVTSENRHRSRFVSDLLKISWTLYPLAQGLALCLPPSAGLLTFALLDVIFKCGTAHTILRSRWALARAIDAKLARLQGGA